MVFLVTDQNYHIAGDGKVSSYIIMCHHKTGFNCESLLIVNCENF